MGDVLLFFLYSRSCAVEFLVVSFYQLELKPVVILALLFRRYSLVIVKRQ